MKEIDFGVVDLDKFALDIIDYVDYDICKEAKNMLDEEGECEMVDEIICILEDLILEIVD